MTAENVGENSFLELDDLYLLQLNLVMLIHVVEYVSLLGTFKYLNAIKFELFNLIYKKCPKKTSTPDLITLEEAVKEMN